jgi:hypothetical protein
MNDNLELVKVQRGEEIRLKFVMSTVAPMEGRTIEQTGQDLRVYGSFK